MSEDTMRSRKPLRCEVCGVEDGVKKVFYRKPFGQYLCDKHNCQMQTKGRITNPSPRGCFDKNDYVVKDHVVYMNLYNRQEEVVCVVKFDERFLDDLKDRKWRPIWKTNKYYAITIGSPESGLSHEYMHRIIAKLAGMDLGG